MSETVADLLRWVAMGSLVAAAFGFWGVYRAFGPLRDGRPAGWERLLPRHVSRVALGIVLCLASLTAYVWEHVDERPYLWGAPLVVAIVGAALLAYGLRDMVRFQRLKLRHGRRAEDVPRAERQPPALGDPFD